MKTPGKEIRREGAGALSVSQLGDILRRLGGVPRPLDLFLLTALVG